MDGQQKLAVLVTVKWDDQLSKVAVLLHAPYREKRILTALQSVPSIVVVGQSSFAAPYKQ